MHGSAAALVAPLRVAVVGSRSAPEGSLRWAYTCARELASAGACIVSGLARGVDAAAHRGALDAGGLTVAILAHGVDPARLEAVYPPEHLTLAQQIVAGGGAVASAWPAGAPVAGWRFAVRDRHQVALSHGVVAVCSEPDGGTMHTVRAALRAGVPLFVPAAPHDVGAGLDLLRSGRAQPVVGASAVLDALSRPAPGALWR